MFVSDLIYTIIKVGSLVVMTYQVSARKGKNAGGIPLPELASFLRMQRGQPEYSIGRPIKMSVFIVTIMPFPLT